MKYKRILLKLSGEALMGEQKYGIDPKRLDEYAQQIKQASELGVQIGIVIGGGNIFRGVAGATKGFDRVKGDYMGMMATVINSLALQSSFEKINAKCLLYTTIRMEPIAKFFNKDMAVEAMQKNEIVIFAAGTGNPFFTTDTASALKAVETKCDVLLKGTRVDGVYTADPEKEPNAKKFTQISYDEVYDKKLKVMDMTAFTMCKENKLPIYVFDMNTVGNLEKVLKGEHIGTIVN